jgi:hypothetical protein
MSGIVQTMLGWCKCTLTYRLFLALPSYEWKTHLKDELPCTWKTHFRRHGNCQITRAYRCFTSIKVIWILILTEIFESVLETWYLKTYYYWSPASLPITSSLLYCQQLYSLHSRQLSQFVWISWLNNFWSLLFTFKFTDW